MSWADKNDGRKKPAGNTEHNTKQRGGTLRRPQATYSDEDAPLLKNALASALPSAPASRQEKAMEGDVLPLPNRADPDASIEPRDGGPDCPKCGNKRYIIDANGALKPCDQCNTAQDWRINSVRAFSSRGEVARRQTFLNFKTTFNSQESAILAECRDEAEKFADDPHERWLVVWGERGSGKSHLCAAVDNHLWARCLIVHHHARSARLLASGD